MQSRSLPDALLYMALCCTGKTMETLMARLNLIDLAGSERTDSAGTSGQMLKEGNAINLSLTALGGCIKALSEGKRPSYRDSKLTLLLQGSMTNGKVWAAPCPGRSTTCWPFGYSGLHSPAPCWLVLAVLLWCVGAGCAVCVLTGCPSCVSSHFPYSHSTATTHTAQHSQCTHTTANTHTCNSVVVVHHPSGPRGRGTVCVGGSGRG